MPAAAPDCPEGVGNYRRISLARPLVATCNAACAWALALREEPGRLQGEPGEGAGQRVVEHDAQTAPHVFVEVIDWKGLQHIEEAEQQEAGEQPGPARGRRQHGQPEADEIVPDDA